MNDGSTTPRNYPKFLTAIRQEFERAERTASAQLEGPQRTRRGRLLAAATLVGLLGLGGAAAGTGLIGGVIPDDEKDVHAGTGDQYVVATGSSSVAGGWRLSSLRHEAEDGEGAGDCLKLELTIPPPGTPIVGTLLCQRVGEAEFKANSIPVVNAATGEAEALVFGAAPKAATSVVARGTSARAELTAAPEYPGDAWVVAIPSGTAGPEISWSEGGKTQDTLDASPYLDQLGIWERNILRDRR